MHVRLTPELSLADVCIYLKSSVTLAAPLRQDRDFMVSGIVFHVSCFRCRFQGYPGFEEARLEVGSENHNPSRSVRVGLEIIPPIL